MQDETETTNRCRSGCVASSGQQAGHLSSGMSYRRPVIGGDGVLDTNNSSPCPASCSISTGGRG